MMEITQNTPDIFNNRFLESDFDKDSYLVVSKRIYENEFLSPGAKLCVSLIRSLARNKFHEASVGTKYIAEYFNVTRRTAQNWITELELSKLITIRTLGKKRFFSPVYRDNDVHALITSDVLKNNELTSTYKLTLGRIIAGGWNNPVGGWDYDTMEDMASDLGLSISSLYRHLKVLKDTKEVSHSEQGRNLFIPTNKYSVENHRLATEKAASLVKALDLEDDPIVDDIINKLANRNNRN